LGTGDIGSTSSEIGDVFLADSKSVKFGADQDVTMGWDATDFDILAGTDAYVIKFGTGTKSFDIWWYASSATSTVKLDEGADTVTFDNVDIYTGDADFIKFGDSQDVTMAWDGTDFDVLAAADDSGWVWGADNDKAFLMTWHGNGAGDDVIFTPSANTWALR